MEGISNRAIACGTAGAVICLLLLLPSAALADCGVTKTGIPADVVASLDPWGVRQAAANSGMSIGGIYYGELFTNSGGVDQGTEYDGALKLSIRGRCRLLYQCQYDEGDCRGLGGNTAAAPSGASKGVRMQ